MLRKDEVNLMLSTTPLRCKGDAKFHTFLILALSGTEASETHKAH